MPPAPQHLSNHCDLILVGGVPGAGKSTAIRTVDSHPAVTARDPEYLRRRLAAVLPRCVAYRRYRSLVHLIHNVTVVADLAAGPVPGRTLVVHDPGTGPHRRPLFVWLAGVRGWRTVSLWVNVDRQSAQEGQILRGRIVNAHTFNRHWERWQLLRTALPREARAVADSESSAHLADRPVVVVERSDAAATLARLCGIDSTPGPVSERTLDGLQAA